jgi:hypothetical protein
MNYELRDGCVNSNCGHILIDYQYEVPKCALVQYLVFRDYTV